MMTLRKVGHIAKEVAKSAVSTAAGCTVSFNLSKTNPLGRDDVPNVLVSSLVGIKVLEETDKFLDAAEILIVEGGKKIGNKIADKKAAKAAKKEDE